MGDRGPVPSCVDEWYKRGGTSVAVASVAYHCWRASPLPTERTSLTVSVVICASTTVSVPSC